MNDANKIDLKINYFTVLNKYITVLLILNSLLLADSMKFTNIFLYFYFEFYLINFNKNLIHFLVTIESL